jgi:hypothetical protein
LTFAVTVTLRSPEFAWLILGMRMSEDVYELDLVDLESTRRSSFVERVADSWRDMGAATRRLIDEEPSEARLLFYVMFSDIIFFLSWTIKTVVAPTASAAEKLPVQIGLWLVLALFARTTTMYLFAGLLKLLSQVFGGRGGWYETRVAVFWGALVAAPFGFLAALVTVGLSYVEEFTPILSNPIVAMLPYYLGLLPFLWLISAGVAEAQRFSRVSTLFSFLSFGAIALTLVGLYLSARGVI